MPNDVISQLLVIFITISVQIWFVHKVKSRYKTGPNIYIFHPIFFINLVEILFFFSPFVFFLLNKGIYDKGYIFNNSSMPLVIYCISLLNFNIVCFFLEGVLLKKLKVSNSEDTLFDFKQSEFKLWIIIYVVVWIARLITISIGTYWHVFVTPEMQARRDAFSHITSLLAFFTVVLAPIFWYIASLLYFTQYKSNKKYRTIFKLLIFAEIIFYLPSGGKLLALMPIIAYFIANYMVNGFKIFIKQFAVFILIVSLLLPLHNLFRGTGKISIESIKKIQKSKENYLSQSISQTFNRAENFSAYFVFVEKVESFLKGKTYNQIFSAPIPRFFWHNKPKAANANEIGRKYGLLGNDFITSPAIGMWAEAYLNFGFSGLFLIGTCMSIFSLFLFKHMMINRTLWSSFYCYYIFFLYVTRPQSMIGGMISDVIKLFIVLFLFKLLIKAHEKRIIYWTAK